MRQARRIRIQAIGVTALMLVAAACSTTGDSSSGPADQIVVGSYGGDYDNFHKQFVVPAYDAEYESDAPTVTFDSTDATSRVTKVIAQKDSSAGGFDVIMQSDTDLPRLINAGVLTKLDMSKMSNASHIKKNLANDYCVPQIYSAEVIIYNKDKMDKPDSWKVFWDPQYKGKIGVVSTIFQQWFFVASAAAKGGDPGDDWDAGTDLIKQLGGNVRVYGSQDQLGQAMISGEIWLTENRKARTYQWNKAAGGNIDSVVPVEGTIPTTFYACIPKNAPHPDDAYKFLNAMLDSSAQVGFAKGMGYSTTVDNADLPDDLIPQIGFTPDEQKMIYPVDFDVQAKAYNDRQSVWQQDVVTK